MPWRAVLLAVVLLLACRLPEEVKDACNQDGDCRGGRLCLSGVCRPRSDPPAPVFTRFQTAFQDLGHTSSYPIGLESPRDNRFEIFVIAPTGGLANRGWFDDVLDPVWYAYLESLTALKDGTDATSWGDLRQDLITRDRSDTAVHVYFEPKPPQVGWQPVGTRPGRFRAALTHLGRNRMIAFQVDAATGELWRSRYEGGRWSEWSAGPAGKLGGGLDAATLYGSTTVGQAPPIAGALLVGRNEAGALITAIYDLSSDSVGAWRALESEPPGGSEGQPTVLTHPAGHYHIFVSARMGGVWGAAGRVGSDPGPFHLLGNGEGSGGDLDAVSWPVEDGWRVAMVRRDPLTGNVQLGQMESDGAGAEPSIRHELHAPEIGAERSTRRQPGP